MRIYRPEEAKVLEGMSGELIAEICRVHVTTANRWKRYKDPSYPALQLLKLHQYGELGAVDLKWAHWRLREGRLISPDGQSFTPGDVLSTTYWQQLAKSYQTEQRLARQADWIDEKWRPAPEQTEIRETA